MNDQQLLKDTAPQNLSHNEIQNVAFSFLWRNRLTRACVGSLFRFLNHTHRHTDTQTHTHTHTHTDTQTHTHTHTGLLCTRDQYVAETST
jgi:hypothetical protein